MDNLKAAADSGRSGLTSHSFGNMQIGGMTPVRVSVIPMKCADLQFILPLYPENGLSESDSLKAAEHLDECPVCRQRLADTNDIRNELGRMSRPVMPSGLTARLREQTAEQLAGRRFIPAFAGLTDSRRWFRTWLMPYAVGSLTTLLVSFTLLWVIVSSEIQPKNGRIQSETVSASNTTILYPYQSPNLPVSSDISPMDYASSRLAFAQESPSINPRGSLVEFAKYMGNEGSDGEVMVVADIYGNGAATISEVVEASGNSQAIGELQKALTSDSAAAFVPASFDHRAEAVRVVLKIQNVSVNTDLY